MPLVKRFSFWVMRFIILFSIFIHTITQTIILLFVNNNRYFVITGPWGEDTLGLYPTHNIQMPLLQPVVPCILMTVHPQN